MAGRNSGSCMRMRRGKARRPRHAMGVLSLALIAATITATHADAGWRRHTSVSSDADSGWREGFASIVVDAKTGKVLQESNADRLRHPASLTKIMTLYLLFEQIEAGRLRLDSKITVSGNAADAAPTKLGLDAGEKIEVEDAIKAVVTRSANDMAIAIGEAVAGSEDAFAARMTRKARALGMNSTTFTNASGLPDKDQVTTARDLAILGRAIQDRFPRLYRFFSLRTFIWRGSQIAQSQPPARHRWCRRHQDRLHPRLRLQSRHQREARQSLHRRRRARRPLFRRARCADARTDRCLHAARLCGHAHRTDDGGSIGSPPRPSPGRNSPPRSRASFRCPAPAPVAGSRDPIRPTPVRTVLLGKNNEQQVAELPNSGTLGTLTISPFGDVNAGPAQSLQVSAYSDVKNIGAPAAFRRDRQAASCRRTRNSRRRCETRDSHTGRRRDHQLVAIDLLRGSRAGETGRARAGGQEARVQRRARPSDSRRLADPDRRLYRRA